MWYLYMDLKNAGPKWPLHEVNIIAYKANARSTIIRFPQITR